MKRIYVSKREKTFPISQATFLALILAFAFGCVLTATVVLNFQVSSVSSDHQLHPQSILEQKTGGRSDSTLESRGTITTDISTTEPSQVLQGQKILVVIAAFDFGQIPHLEEVLDGYHDVAIAGAAVVDVVIHATVAYPVMLIDLWNTRFTASNFSITIALKPKSLRLHLVDEHRTLFYERLNDYDLFIYTEDDIRVTPTTVATYLAETRVVASIAEKPSNYNIGIVRYEYNYPPNTIIDDKTRHATQNVTRVYWEHSGFERPVVPNAAYATKGLPKSFISMKNHHQGMFLATRELLEAWKNRKGCDFDKIRNRPGRGNQPSEGTQRVWMSSQMLYGGRHCGVQQVLPASKFGALTVLHLPNKNYRRVGKYRKRVFSDGTEVFEAPHSSLLSAMEFHIGLRRSGEILMVGDGGSHAPQTYRGIRMVDQVTHAHDRTALLERRLLDYENYVKRGGIPDDHDMEHMELLEDA